MFRHGAFRGVINGLPLSLVMWAALGLALSKLLVG